MPAVYTIPPHLPFAQHLAAGIAERWNGTPETLPHIRVLLPTRRAGRALAQAFLRQAEGKAMLLPVIQPLGDIAGEEIALSGFGETPELAQAAMRVPPAISPLRRQLLLAGLVHRWYAKARPTAPRFDHAVRLAQSLADFLDELQSERVDPTRLHDVAPEDYQKHWQQTLAFLDILLAQWPGVAKALGVVDPVTRRDALLRLQAERWRASPPATPVIAAGSTGSIPATAALLKVIAELPQGAVVLPGLDRHMDTASWEALEPPHPQYGLKKLLATFGITREEVALWPGCESGAQASPRAVLLSEAMRPAATTPQWRKLPPIHGAVQGLTRLECKTQEEEAAAIALMLRETLETPGKTAALVTPDRTLARRVGAHMKRWGIAIDDSGGTTLSHLPAGVFLQLAAEMAASKAAPVPLLALLKHPLASGGQEAAAFRANVRALERAILRGVRAESGFEALVRLLEQNGNRALVRWLTELGKTAAPFLRHFEHGRAPLARLVGDHIAFAEALAKTPAQTGAERLWHKEDGEATAQFVKELLEYAHDGGEVETLTYPGLFASLLERQIHRPAWGTHPRLAILSPQEARMQHFDLLVLGGLNEGTWPPSPEASPWLARPMRATLGLPPPEREIGLSAHDFATLTAACPETVLTRARKVEGAPAQPSRWWLRLEAVLKATGLEKESPPAKPWTAWAAALHTPEHTAPCPPPAPCPPAAARPRALSVTRVEMLMRDPYALYASEILKLKPLDALDEDPSAADFGTCIHEALEKCARGWETIPPQQRLTHLLACGQEVFGPLLLRPAVRSFWWPRFERIAEWFIGFEEARRREGATVYAETRGALEIGGVMLAAKADRVEHLPQGGVAVMDYKTGASPKEEDIRLGFSPQMTLEALIAESGGFEHIPAAAAQTLLYLETKGGHPPVKEKPVKGDIATLTQEAREGVTRLLSYFLAEDAPFLSQPWPRHAPRYSDYTHLARIKEWQ